MLVSKYGERAKHVVVERAKKGLLDARAEILVTTHHNVTEPYAFGDYGYRESPVEDSRSDFCILERGFWSLGHATAGSVLEDDPESFVGCVAANWEIGDFSKKQFFSGDDQPWTLREAAGVMFNIRQLSHLSDAFRPPDLGSPPNLGSKGRSTVYDWEGAFADVAAKLYHDLEFIDVHARGVQAEIIGALRESFEKNRLPVPEDTSLKSKARRIVAALRAK